MNDFMIIAKICCLPHKNLFKAQCVDRVIQSGTLNVPIGTFGN